ncbi:TetR/AcrR family transcriptional regulator [Leifsonia sp. 2TAF2]|uniref:TetR/AcrR family transcriptional regulator n=1 Tax=Leifsonia sp. 2TAF2 TaxID=3233009 RepID=UPI003F963E78
MENTVADARTNSSGASTDGAARSTRTRILDEAAELFYAQGIRAVSADKIIERVGITKVTFYRYFRTKHSLVVAYLEQQGARERGQFDRVLTSSNDAAEAFRVFAEAIGTASCRPGFRGCPFINAAAEYADPDSPVRKVIADHRAWYRDTFAAMLQQLGVTDPQAAAGEVMMLRDGAMVAGYLGDAQQVGQELTASIFAVVKAHQSDPGV